MLDTVLLANRGHKLDVITISTQKKIWVKLTKEKEETSQSEVVSSKSESFGLYKPRKRKKKVDDRFFIKDFCVYGEKEDKVLSMTKNSLWKHDINYNKITKKGKFLGMVEFTDLKKDIGEMAWTISVCPESKYAAVAFCSSEAPLRCTKLQLLDIKADEDFTLVKEVSYLEKVIDPIFNVNFYGYSYDHLILTGMTYSNESTFFVFDYDMVEDTFTEIERMRKDLKVCYPHKVKKFGASIMATDNDKSLLEIKIDF